METFNFEMMARDAFQSARINLDEFDDSPNWVVANRLFRFGRTKSIKFCEMLGINPDSMTTERVNE